VASCRQTSRDGSEGRLCVGAASSFDASTARSSVGGERPSRTSLGPSCRGNRVTGGLSTTPADRPTKGGPRKEEVLTVGSPSE
jgi:hypothetical protein